MILQPVSLAAMHPLCADPGEIRFGAKTVGEMLADRLSALPKDLRWRSDFFPDDRLLETLAGAENFTVVADDGEVAGGTGGGEAIPFSGVRIRYPWHLLNIAEMLLPAMTDPDIRGEISPRATVEGVIALGENSRILPGVYIEGNCVIGRNCKIGPNCYLRGNTVIGDDCHIGQAVEIKNSVIGCRTAVGHLSYAGDSVIGSRVNFGAGTIIANLRHDGRNHRAMVAGAPIDTGRRKFGAIVGDGVHTGIHTAIYPGRKLSPGASTRPGEVVRHDL